MKPFRLTLALLLMGALQAPAAVILTLEQVGDDVVLSGGGTLNTDAWTLSGGIFAIGTVQSSNSTVVVGGSIATADNADVYSSPVNFSAPANFGTAGSFTLASSGTGDSFGIFDGDLYVPVDFISDSALSGSATFANTTIADMEVLPGSYVFSWGSGATADSLTLNIVPEPATGTLLLGVLGLLALRRRR